MSQPPYGPQGPGRPQGPGAGDRGPGGAPRPWGTPPPGQPAPPPGQPGAQPYPGSPPSAPPSGPPPRPAPGAPGYPPPPQQAPPQQTPQHQPPPAPPQQPPGGPQAPTWPPAPASRPRGIDQGDLPTPNLPEDEDDAPRRGNAGLLIIGLLLGILVIGGGVILFLFWQGTFTTYVMDSAQVEDGVTEILQDPDNGFGIASVSSVDCPSGQEIVVQATFNCTVSIDGEEQRVPVDILNEDGDFRVNQPK